VRGSVKGTNPISTFPGLVYEGIVDCCPIVVSFLCGDPDSNFDNARIVLIKPFSEEALLNAINKVLTTG
jgi:hypothetical protein